MNKSDLKSAIEDIKKLKELYPEWFEAHIKDDNKLFK